MELVIPSQAMDFDFNSAKNSPYPSPPSTPRRFGDYFFSAPTSPSRMSEFYREFDDEFSMVVNDNNYERSSKVEDFAFDISAESNNDSLSAEDLFDGGKIKSQKPSPAKLSTSSRIPRIPDSSSIAIKASKSPTMVEQGKKTIKDVPSPSRKQTSTSDSDRGRGRTTHLSSSNSGRRAARSLSPLRVSQYPWEEEQQQQEQQQQHHQPQQLTLAKKGSFESSSASSPSSSKGSKKWRLRDFLLFRSASDGRAYEKDPLRKYSNVSKKHEDVKNASFRSTDSSTGSGATRSRRKGPISAHELHYTMNKAASEEMKKKTFLPYKQGILGRLAFNPSVSSIANSFKSFTRS